MQPTKLHLTIAVAVFLAIFSASAEDQVKKTAGLIRVEASLASGWLRHYDYNQHRELGEIASQYFAARSKLSPEALVKTGLLKDKTILDDLRKRWRDIPLQAETEPIAVDFVARDGLVKAIIFTRVQTSETLDVYNFSVERKKGKWLLETCGLVTGFCIE